MSLRQLARPRGGNVVVEILVRADGTPGETIIETSSGYKEIDELTQHLLASADIEPLRVGGQATESWQLLKWRWRANEDPERPVSNR
jgi:TonB family protein